MMKYVQVHWAILLALAPPLGCLPFGIRAECAENERALDAPAYDGIAYFASLQQSDLDSLQIVMTSMFPFTDTRRMICGSAAKDLVEYATFSQEPWKVTGDREILTLPSSTLAAALDTMESMALQQATEDRDGWILLTVACSVDGEKHGFETHVTWAENARIIGSLLVATEPCTSRYAWLVDLGCWLGSLPDTPPADVTDAVTVVLKDFRNGPKEQHYAAEAVVTNVGSSSLQEPVLLLVALPYPAQLLTFDGYTCVIQRPADEYVVLRTNGPIGIGDSVSVSLRFYGTELSPEKIETWVYAGRGIP